MIPLVDLKKQYESVGYTFVATAAAVFYVGAKPVFVDIYQRNCNIDPGKIEAAITSKTKAIMPAHLYGSCAEMDPILDLARRHKLIVIEDAAAHGAEYKGRRAGSMGDLACFSFYPGKNLGAYGEGGTVVTSDERASAPLYTIRFRFISSPPIDILATVKEISQRRNVLAKRCFRSRFILNWRTTPC